MTEKRFTFADGFKIVAIRDNGEIMNSKQVCDKLNQLHEEVRQLNAIVDFYKSFQKDARELEKENERLKRLLKSINYSFTFDDNYASWFEDCIIVSKEGLKEIDLGSDFE